MLLHFSDSNRLTDHGFEKDIGFIMSTLQKVPKTSWRRRSVLVSATLNDQVRRLAKITLKNPVNFDTTQALPGTISQPATQPAMQTAPPLLETAEAPMKRKREHDDDDEQGAGALTYLFSLLIKQTGSSTLRTMMHQVALLVPLLFLLFLLQVQQTKPRNCTRHQAS